MEWQAVFFDFDGVILDSVDIKTEAFAGMFRPYGQEIEKKVIEYHLANGGISRYEKFKYYYNNFLHKNITDEELTQLGETFADIVFERLLNAPFIDGALDTINALYDKNTPMFIVSGTPQDELERILSGKKLDSYFKSIYGSPPKKDEVIFEIKTHYGYDLSECIFIGDSLTDYYAARMTGTKFIGIIKNGKTSPFPHDTLTSESIENPINLCLT